MLIVRKSYAYETLRQDACTGLHGSRD